MDIFVHLKDGYTIEDIQDTGFVFDRRLDYKTLGFSVFRGAILEARLKALRAHPAVSTADIHEEAETCDPRS